MSPIQWNFAKFLLGKDGTVIGRFPHTLDPLELTSKIESIVSDTL